MLSTGRDANFDTLTAGSGATLATDCTLGGLCAWVDAEAPRRCQSEPTSREAERKHDAVPLLIVYDWGGPRIQDNDPYRAGRDARTTSQIIPAP